MKMPWTKSIEILSIKMQKTFDKMSKVIIDEDKKLYVKLMGQVSLLKNSEQMKYNRFDARLIELETCFKCELEHYRKTLEIMERSAAADADKGRL